MSEDYPQAPTSHSRLPSPGAEPLGLGKGAGVAPWGWKVNEATREPSFQKTDMTSLCPLGGRTAVLAAETTRESVDRCDVVYLGKNTVYSAPLTLEHFLGSASDPESSSSSLVPSWRQHFPALTPSRWSQKQNKTAYALILKDVVGGRWG